MKPVLTFLLCLYCFLCQSQAAMRQKGESSDSLVERTLKPGARNGGPVFEYTDDTSSIILYVQVQQQDTSKLTTVGSTSYPVSPDATFTLLCVLYATDNIHYSSYVIDTLDVNSGCCPCWQPVTVSNFFFVNRDEDPEQEIGVVLMKWVRPDCSSSTSSSVSIYDNITSFRATKTLAKLSEHLSETSFEKELQEDQPVIPARFSIGYFGYETETK